MQAVTTELLHEASADHPLYGMAFTVIGRSNARADVLLKVADRWALVHLKWSGKPEAPPWPTCVIFDSASDVEQALTDDDADDHRWQPRGSRHERALSLWPIAMRVRVAVGLAEPLLR